MDSDLSVCIIPDTPSASVLGGKIMSQRSQAVIEIPSDDSYRSTLTSELNISNEGQSPSLCASERNDRRSSSNSPVFNCRRRLQDNKWYQKSDGEKHNVHTISVKMNTPPLPGSPEFARERANALKKKKMKNKTSPFTKSQYDLSPFKAGINQLPAWSLQESVKSDLNSVWSASPLEAVHSNEKKGQQHSGFVKSSTLLGKVPLKGSSRIDSVPPEKGKKRKVETVTNCNLNDVVRPKVQKAQASYGWPSSSDSSDDESLMFVKKKKLKINAKNTDKAHALKNHMADSISCTSELESSNNLSPKSKEGKKAGKTWTVTSCSDKTGTFSNIPVLKVSAVKKNRSEMGKTCKKTTVSGKKHHGPIDYLDSSDDEFLSSVTESSLLGHGKIQHSNSVIQSTKGVAERKSKLPLTHSQSTSSAQLVGSIANSGSFSSVSNSGNSPPSPIFVNDPFKCWSPSFQLSTSPSLNLSNSCRNSADNIFSISRRSPVFSSIPDRPTAHRTNTAQSSQERKKKKSDQSHRNLPPSLLQDSPVRNQRVESRNTGTGSPIGSQDNPIDLVSATPETRKALEEITQMQADEEFARKMQEQLDLEFAMSLQNSEDHVRHQGPGIPQGAEAVHHQEATPSPHWHAYSPTRVRGPARGVPAGNRRRRRGGVHPDEAFVQLVRQTIGTLNVELGQSSDNLQFDGWLAHSPSASRRRGRGLRAGHHYSVFSPGTEGEDYENLMNLAEMLGDVKNKGLSKTDLGRLPVVSYKKTEGQEIEECNICMTDYEEGDSQKILPCFHSFHCICIDKWIKKNATCPICRVEVKVTSP